ncbi:hypothetical protein SAMN05216489_00285 [Streptomyces sp. 3213]|nr:hypothetical protein SAMN05216489_00285 [Streptomyces sp. 3213] [Streptomyces sp. 3213.3]
MTASLHHLSVTAGSERVSVQTDAERARARIDAARRAHAPHAGSPDRVECRRARDSTEWGAYS